MIEFALILLLAVVLVAYIIINQIQLSRGDKKPKTEIATTYYTSSIGSNTPTVTVGGGGGGSGAAVNYFYTPPQPTPKVTCGSCGKSVDQSAAATVDMELPFSEDSSLPVSIHLCGECVNFA